MKNREFMPGDRVKIFNIIDDGKGQNIGIIVSSPHEGKVPVELKGGTVQEFRLTDLERLDR